jgi:hypothetical protein
MGQKPDMDQGLSDEELLALPAENVSPASLVRIWELHARQTEEKAQEATEIRFQHRQVDQKTEHEREEERRHEREVLEYQATMREVERRSDELLEKIEREERRAEKRRQEIEDRAIRLHDGRRVYVDGANYRDEEGRTLTGPECDEASAAHSEDPSAPTWAEKQTGDRRIQEVAQMKREAQNLRSEARDGSTEGMTSEQLKQHEKDLDARIGQDETRFRDKMEAAAKTGTEYGSDDYMAAYGRTTSYASAIEGGTGKPLSGDFTPAAAGEGAERNTPAPASPAPSYTP